jgi:hypothetical protein
LGGTGLRVKGFGVWGAAVLVVFAGCAARVALPSADAGQRPFPDMGGRTVMLLPVQGAVPLVALPAAAEREPVPLSDGERAALEAELAYWLPEQARRIRWVLPATIERAALRSPLLELRVRDLAVGDFQRARLETIGDPLYGELRRISALMDARPALLPVGAVWIPETGGTGRVHLAVALIDTFGGDVIWYGVVAGSPAAHGDATAVASTAQALARLISR